MMSSLTDRLAVILLASNLLLLVASLAQVGFSVVLIELYLFPHLGFVSPHFQVFPYLGLSLGIATSLIAR